MSPNYQSASMGCVSQIQAIKEVNDDQTSIIPDLQKDNKNLGAQSKEQSKKVEINTAQHTKKSDTGSSGPDSKNKINNYKLGKHLGKGSFGSVLMCTEIATKIEYAVKVFELGSDCDTNEIVELTNEFANTLKVQHTNIITVFTQFAGKVDDAQFYYIVMEKADGNMESFIQKISNEKDWQINQMTLLRIICLQIVSGVEHMHQNKLIHRDLKPENVLVFNSKTLQNIIVKICDLGLAKRIDSTQASSCVGTQTFMAPELFEENLKYSYPADVWSLGCIFYKICCGNNPFKSITCTQIANYQINEIKDMKIKDIISQILIIEPNKRSSAIVILQSILVLVENCTEFEYIKNNLQKSDKILQNIKNSENSEINPVQNINEAENDALLFNNINDSQNNQDILKRIQQTNIIPLNLVSKMKSIQNYQEWVQFSESVNYSKLKQSFAKMLQLRETKVVQLENAKDWIDIGVRIIFPCKDYNQLNVMAGTQIVSILAICLKNKNGLLSGFGVNSYNNRSTYVGEILNNEESGFGQWYGVNGNLMYSGIWQNRFYHMFGEVDIVGNKYSGQFQSRFISGHGKYTYTNGTKIEGIFNDSSCSGELILANGVKYTGEITGINPIGCFIILDSGKKFEYSISTNKLVGRM